jgi:hypothetical protein
MPARNVFGVGGGSAFLVGRLDPGRVKVDVGPNATHRSVSTRGRENPISWSTAAFEVP